MSKLSDEQEKESTNERGIITDYQQWLHDKIKTKKYNPDDYIYLFDRLYKRVFTYTLIQDSSLESHGKDLREQFRYDTNYDKLDYRALEGSCSVLEMLIGMSVDCEKDIMTFTDDTNLFWIALDELDLLRYSDKAIENGTDDKKVTSVTSEIDEIIDVFMHRKYDRDGKRGTPFPSLGDSLHNYRKLSLWDQAMKYLSICYANIFEDF